MPSARAVSTFAVALLLLAPSAADAQQPPAPAPAQTKQPWQPSPAQAADPPVLPPPTHAAQGGTSAGETTPAVPIAPGAPTSISGTDVVGPGSPSGSNAPLVPVDGSAGAPEEHKRLRALERRVSFDETSLQTLKDELSPLRHVHIMGYVQLQYLADFPNAAASPNLQTNGALPPGISSSATIARTDGSTTNKDAFRLRRSRLGATYETDVVRVFLQVEILPSGGPANTQSTIARNAEVTGVAHWTRDVRTEFTGGLFVMPLSLELEELSLFRPFIERSWTSLNLFPSERDLGVHAKTIGFHDHAYLDVGVVNGHRLGEPGFATQADLNASKDFYAALAAKKLGPFDATISGYVGRGQLVDTNVLRVKNYDRHALNLGARFAKELVPVLGETRLMAELLFGQNMDTGVVYPFGLPAIPASFTDDVAALGERGLYLRAEQDLTRWGVAGFRFDTYTPDVGQKNDARDTYTFMLGAKFTKHLRLVNEFSWGIDNVHPKGTDAPSRQLAEYTAWMQGSFY